MIFACAIPASEQVFGRFSWNCAQFVAGLSGKFRVVLENLNRPFDLLGDSLSGSVAAGEKLQVTQIIVRGRFEPVVNCLFLGQFPTKVLFHDVSVLVDVVAADTVDVRKAEQDVTSHHAFSDLSFGARSLFLVRLDQISALKRTAAWVAACFCSVKAVPFGCEDGTAYRTGSSLDVCSSDVRTSARAVKRVFAEFFVVLAQLSRSSTKGAAAIFARKLDLFDSLAFAAVNGLVSFVTRERAITTTGVSGSRGEISSTLFAFDLNGHAGPSDKVAKNQYHIPLCLSTHIYEGAQ